MTIERERSLFIVKDIICDEYDACSDGCPLNHCIFSCTRYTSCPDRYSLVKDMQKDVESTSIIISLLQREDFRKAWFSLIGGKVR